MGWRSTLVLVGLVLVVGLYLWFTDMPTTSSDRQAATQGQQPGAQSVQALRKLLAFEPAEVIELQLQRAGQRRGVQRENGIWQGTDDPTVVNDFLHSLAEMRVLLDIPASPNELAEYGLDPPLGVIALRVNGQAQSLILQLGARNPATTGVYVRIGEDGAVVLAGALVEWEFDKLFRRLRPAGPAGPAAGVSSMGRSRWSLRASKFV